MMSAIKGFVLMRESSAASMHDLQQPSSMTYVSFRCSLICPFAIVLKAGNSPGCFTMKAMSFAGSPPMLKNSSSFSSTKSLKIGCVAIRTRWFHFFFKTRPNATNG